MPMDDIEPGMCTENGVEFCGCDDAYPPRLRCIDPWPPAIARRGDELELDHNLDPDYKTRRVHGRLRSVPNASCARRCPQSPVKGKMAGTNDAVYAGVTGSTPVAKRESRTLLWAAGRFGHEAGARVVGREWGRSVLR